MRSIGDYVTIEKGKAKGSRGKIVKVEKLFQETLPNGEFDWSGLMTIESSIPFIKVPYEFDGKTLIVKMPETKIGNYVDNGCTRTSKFSGYGYTIDINAGYFVFVSENELGE